MPATRPWRSDSLPSVAETWRWLITFSSIGRAPELTCLASVSASDWLKSPVISAPLLPSMPWGYCS